MNYIKRFKNEQDLSVSLGNNYSEDQLIYIFLNNFHQCGKYNTQIASHQKELIREEHFPDQKYSYISSLQNNKLNIDSSSGSGRTNERSNLVQTKCTFCGGSNHSAEN